MNNMDVKIGFTKPIITKDRSSPKLSAVEAFDDYFDLEGRKYRVFGPKGGNDNGKDYVVRSEDVKTNIPLNVLKVFSYCTLIVPLIMLIGKAIARSKYNFFSEKKIEAIRDNTSREKKRASKDKEKEITLEEKKMTLREKTKKDKAATKIQSAFRGFILRKKMKAATCIQAQYKAYKARKDFLETKKAATCIQAHYRAYLAKKEATEELQKLKKLKLQVLKVFKELADTEESHIQSMADQLKIMQDEDFKRVLKMKGSKDEQWLKTFLKDYLTLAHKGKAIQLKLEKIVAPKSKQSLKEEIAATIEGAVPGNRRPAAAASAPMGKKQVGKAKKGSEVKKKKDPLEKKSAPTMKEEVENISKLILSEEFKEYLDLMIKVLAYNEKFNAMLDDRKLPGFIKKFKKGAANFAPCVILVQRLARYPLLLKEAKNQVGKMGLGKEIQSIEKALEFAKGKTGGLDLNSEVDYVKALLAEYKRVRKTNLKLWKKKAIAKKKKDVNKEIKFYLLQKKNSIAKQKAQTSLIGKELELQKLRNELLALQKS